MMETTVPQHIRLAMNDYDRFSKIDAVGALLSTTDNQYEDQWVRTELSRRLNSMKRDKHQICYHSFSQFYPYLCSLCWRMLIAAPLAVNRQREQVSDKIATLYMPSPASSMTSYFPIPFSRYITVVLCRG